MGLKDLFLKKGWAGKTLTREATVEHLNPLLEQHIRLNRAYRYATRHLSDRAPVESFEQAQKTARADVGKLSETVLSCGGVPYTGVELTPQSVDLGHDDAEILHRLREMEQDFQERLAAEMDENHQMRTRAILAVVHTNSSARLDLLRRLTRGLRRPRIAS